MFAMRNVRKRYGDRWALSGFDLDVEDGQTVVVMGPSGCGKSTALRCMVRLIEPDSGSILWRGRSVLDMSNDELRAYRRRVGFVFQRSNLLSRLNVLENTMLPGTMAGRTTVEARRRAHDALERVGIAHLASARPQDLSGGEMQRAAIARAIAQDPELLLWDEPTASLDPILVVDVLRLIESLARSLRCTMVIVTHEVPFALHVADKVVLVSGGEAIDEGRPEDVLLTPASELARQYSKSLSYFTGNQEEKAASL
ncbi:MAG: ATP-binding cassette domain-containing protein [Firmicutes bacterium]|jgi:polar amino acid transport system ATP-binding protein|nr:ATP-binding cassette domain-containing protein [Bacillota bacterium]MDD4792533.1 ATP-binding cassette domain-containing protein [Bacillota bacterium]